jgi:uncharacterized protein
MSLLTALAVYIIPNLYVFFRTRKLLFTARQKILLAVLHLTLVLAFPLTEMASHMNGDPVHRHLLLFGYLTLPFLLYLFLTRVLIDLLLGLNRLVKAVPPDAIASDRGRQGILLALLLVPTVVVAWGKMHFSDLQVHRYEIQIPRRASTLHHLRIGLASDFHLREFTDGGFMQRFVDLVNSQNVDLLLLPGDILEGDRQNEQLQEYERLFRQIRTTHGVFASPGNHESFGRKTRLEFFRQSCITLLLDTSMVVEGAFTLIGRNDNRSQGRKPIEQLVKTAPDVLPIIVLDHRPMDFSKISMTGADIVVSGHTHQGQLFPFNIITELIYEKSWGYTRIQRTHFFVTSGIQVWGPPVRTAGDSELMVIDVLFTP